MKSQIYLSLLLQYLGMYILSMFMDFSPQINCLQIPHQNCQLHYKIVYKYQNRKGHIALHKSKKESLTTRIKGQQ